jgi:ribose transport system permease protein
MSAETSSMMSAGAFDRHSLRDLLTGSVTSIAVTLIAVIVLGLGWIGPNFLSASNITIICAFVAVPLVIAAFASFALLAGVVDLSIGSMAGLSSCITAALIGSGWSVWSAALVAFAACLVGGAVNGIAIVLFGADAIAATLGMLVALRGFDYLIAGPQGSLTAFDVDFYAFTNSTIGPLPAPFIIGLVAIVLATIVVLRMRIGRHVQAVGGDDRAATRAGISVTVVRFAALLLSAFGAGLGGILYVGQLGSASNLTGTGLEFQVYAAMMIGGYSILRGGVGNPLGAALGLLVIAGTTNILDVQAVSPYYTNIIVGLLLLVAVILDRLRGGDAFE